MRFIRRGGAVSLISLSCPNCGGVVQYDPLSLGGRCSYCGHWLENSEPSQRAKELLRQYNGCKTTGDMSGARAHARDMQSEEPGDFRSWWAEYVLDVSHDNGKIEYLESFPAYTEHLNKMARICKAEPTTWKEETLRGEIAALKRDCNEVSRVKSDAKHNLLPLEQKKNSLLEDLAGKQGDLSGLDGGWDFGFARKAAYISGIAGTLYGGFGVGYTNMGGSIFWGILGAIFLSPIAAIVAGIPFALVGGGVGLVCTIPMNKQRKAKISKIQGIISELEFDLEWMQENIDVEKTKIPFDTQDTTIEDLIAYLAEKELKLTEAIESTEQILG